MNVSNPASNQLYKPAVYASLCERPDVTLYVSFQNDIELEQGVMRFSPALASYFGFHVDGTRGFVGVPDAIWPAIHAMKIQTFSVAGGYLNLHFDVDEEISSSKRSATGIVEEIVFRGRELTLRIPTNQSVAKSLNKSIILSLCHMNEYGEAQEGRESMIPITKKQEASNVE